jgi:transcriptional regulator with PAS, ATPase and Fis domain
MDMQGYGIPPQDMAPIDDDQDPEEQEYEIDDHQEDMSIRTANLELIEKVLRKHDGNRKAAAAELGISERTLYRKLKQIR